MRYPAFLPAGGTVGVIAPSFGCTEEPYISAAGSARAFFEAEGYAVRFGENCFRSDGIGKSSTPENCGAEIERFFLNGDADILISMGGGETMCEDLEYVDFAALAAGQPKWFMGFSDNTNLTFLLPTLCDTAAVYGPNFPAFGQRPLHPALTDALSLLRGTSLTAHNYPGWELSSLKTPETPLVPYNITEPFRMRTFPGTGDAAFSGRLLGGCLDCLINLCGTRFDAVRAFNAKYKDDGVIWFLEACDLSPVAIRRALWQLMNAGWFENAKGFLIGRACRYADEAFGLDRISAFTGMLERLNRPVLLDLDIGHLPPMMPLISGAKAEAVTKGNSLTVTMRPE